MSQPRPTKEEIEDCYGMPIHEACLVLGLETKELQKLCREYNIKRWPKTRTKPSTNNLFQQFQVKTNKKPYDHHKERKMHEVIMTQSIPDTKRFETTFAPSASVIMGTLNTTQQKREVSQKLFLGEMPGEMKNLKVRKASENGEEAEQKSPQEVMNVNNLCN